LWFAMCRMCGVNSFNGAGSQVSQILSGRHKGIASGSEEKDESS